VNIVDESIFKAYDIRGIYPVQIDESLAYLIGQGYADYVKPKGEVLVGRDVRIYSEVLQKQVVEGLLDAGIDVVDVGLISTEMCYFGVGSLNLAGGIQVTASHNPPEWHGMNMVRDNVKPLNCEE
jgi:phosphomannomutase